MLDKTKEKSQRENLAKIYQEMCTKHPLVMEKEYKFLKVEKDKASSGPDKKHSHILEMGSMIEGSKTSK
jgi:hypothetical protein